MKHLLIAIFIGASVPLIAQTPGKSNLRQSNPINNSDPSIYIDPAIGNIGALLEPTRPTASLPNQPVRVYPIRKDFLDDEITCFPLTAVSHRLNLLLLPPLQTLLQELLFLLP